MESDAETTRLMLLGLHRLASDVLEETSGGRGRVLLLTVGETGRSEEGPSPRYAGCPVESLVAESSFPEVAWLLLRGELPNVEFLADLQTLLSESAVLPEGVRRFVEELPLHVSESDALRVGITALTAFDPQLEDDEPDREFAKATRLLAMAPLLLGARRGDRPLSAAGIEAEHDVDEHADELSYAARVFRELTGEEPTPAVERAVDAMLVALAEQAGAPSTLAARVVASNGGDVYAAVGAAIAASDAHVGDEHCRRIVALLQRAEEVADVSTWFAERFEVGAPIPGFDREQGLDGRVRALGAICHDVAAEVGHDSYESAARVVERSALDVYGARPTLLWPIARLLWHCGIEADSFGSLLTIARVAGWSAHAIEESLLNRRLAPRWNPCAEAIDYVPLDDRG
jgi:citrate synthase